MCFVWFALVETLHMVEGDPLQGWPLGYCLMESEIWILEG